MVEQKEGTTSAIGRCVKTRQASGKTSSRASRLSRWVLDLRTSRWCSRPGRNMGRETVYFLTWRRLFTALLVRLFDCWFHNLVRLTSRQIPKLCITAPFCVCMPWCYQTIIIIGNSSPVGTRRNSNVTITSKDVATSSWRNNTVVILASCARRVTTL